MYAQGQKQQEGTVPKTLGTRPCDYLSDFLTFAENAHQKGWLTERAIKSIRDTVEEARQRHGRQR